MDVRLHTQVGVRLQQKDVRLHTQLGVHLQQVEDKEEKEDNEEKEVKEVKEREGEKIFNITDTQILFCALSTFHNNLTSVW